MILFYSNSNQGREEKKKSRKPLTSAIHINTFGPHVLTGVCSVLFDTGLVSLSFLPLLQFAAHVVVLLINLVIIYWAVDMDPAHAYTY